MSRPIIAILRGVTPAEALPISDELVSAGISRIEVPLNSPDAFVSIGQIAKRHGTTATIGAGTVLTIEDVRRVNEAGGRLIVSPNADTGVIAETKRLGMESFPGVFTATECFAAIAAGSDGLKIFPASIMGPSGISALKAVLPAVVPVYAVGGAGADNFAEWVQAGADGFGIGSALYKPGDSPAAVAQKAQEIVSAWDTLST